ncbi:hypothetical protein F5X71_08475 [Nocardia brasiliensis]|uniref:Uncharacterized protein n=1 Tax=Nocardia brasiliensis TaxID=37326 RepID=A0A6G9XN63_NOCBR|nr:hypothetical protein [Nocardia brasiliensis]QIS02354.1 hypothetical protein F5X71_08475 [Nocardia brasiliensis]
MAFVEGSKVKIGANGGSEFVVIEVEHNGDPGVVLIKPVIDAGYEFPMRVADLVLIDDHPETA